MLFRVAGGAELLSPRSRMASDPSGHRERQVVPGGRTGPGRHRYVAQREMAFHDDEVHGFAGTSRDGVTWSGDGHGRALARRHGLH